MRGKRKPPIDVRKEKHPLIGPRARLDLTWARETTPITRDQSLVLVRRMFSAVTMDGSHSPADMASRRSARRKPNSTSAPRKSPE